MAIITGPDGHELEFQQEIEIAAREISSRIELMYELVTPGDILGEREFLSPCLFTSSKYMGLKKNTTSNCRFLKQGLL